MGVEALHQKTNDGGAESRRFDNRIVAVVTGDVTEAAAHETHNGSGTGATTWQNTKCTQSPATTWLRRRSGQENRAKLLSR
jgi:hypothetical protein